MFLAKQNIQMNKVISHIHYIYIESPFLKKKIGYTLFTIHLYFNSRQNISYAIIITFNMMYNQIVFLQHKSPSR